MKKILIAVLGMFLTTSAFALNSSELQDRELAKKSVAKVTTYNDAQAFSVEYVGASSACIVEVSTGLFATYPGTGASIDLSFNLSNAAYDTMGELCDAIDADSDYKCQLIDAKRSDNSILTQQKTHSTVQDAKAAGGYNVLIDSGGVQALFVDGAQFELRLGIVPEAGKRVVLKFCTGNTSGTDILYAWGKLSKYVGATDGVTRNDSTVVFSSATLDDASSTIGFSNGINFLEFGKDEHVVIGSSVNDTAQAAENTLVCVWDEK